MNNLYVKCVLIALIVVLHYPFVLSQTYVTDSDQYKSIPDFSNLVYKNKLDAIPDSLGIPKIDSVIINTPFPISEPKISLARLGIISGTSLAILGGLYYREKNAWWYNSSTKFHFYNDYQYVKNIDKIGHFYGAIIFTECFGFGLKWSGFDNESALLYGGILSTLVYAGVETKDGFSPKWGFSIGDMSADLLGAVYPYLQKKISFLDDFNFKYSYWPSKNPYYTKLDKIDNKDEFFTDDYEGQTFWLSVNVEEYLPESAKSFWPDFLNIAGGMSVKNLDGRGGGSRVFLLAPDIDLQKLFKTDNEFLNTLFHYLNYLHLPLPALEISPSFKFFGIYLNP